MALAASAACVLLLALATRPWHVLAVWALNGLVSANEFASCVALLTPWLRARERALYMGLWATCLPVGGAIGNLQAAAGEWLSGSWRGAVALTGGACFLATAVVWHTLEPRGPVAAVGLGDTTDDENGDDGRPMEAEAASHGTNLPEPRPHASDGGAAGDADVVPVWRLLRSPAVPNVAASYFFQKLARYLLVLWLPFWLGAVLKLSDEAAAVCASTVDVGGIIGTVAIGTGTDILAPQRRALATAASVAALVVAFTPFAWFAAPLAASGGAGSWAAAVGFACGVFAYGADCLVSGPVVQDIADRGAAAGDWTVHAAIGPLAALVDGAGSAGCVGVGLVAFVVFGRRSPAALFVILQGLAAAGAVALVRPVALETVAANGALRRRAREAVLADVSRV